MRSLLAALLVITGALTVMAEQPSNPMLDSSVNSAPSEPATTLKATTRMVVLDVVATDKHGKAVTDLKAADFTLLENGHEQKIGSFTSEVGSATGLMTRPAALESSPNVFSNTQFTEPPKTLNVILLDALNTDLPKQMKVRQQMIRFLETMPGGQPIAVYTLNRKLRLLQDFTVDTGVLKELAKDFRVERSTIPANSTGGPRDELLSPGAVQGNPLAAGLQERLQQFVDREAQYDMCVRLELNYLAVQTLAGTLAGYPGRKNLIWVAGTFPLKVFPEDHEGRERALCWFDPYELARRASNTLAEAHIAVYPVDAAGLVTVGLTAIDASYNEIGEFEKGDRRGTRNLIEVQLKDLATGHLTMNELAARTGGKAYYDRNDLHTAIQNGITDGSSYYLIGYYPSDRNWNGKFRKVEVKVDRPGIKLRFRPGYYAIDKQYEPNNSTVSKRELEEALDVSTLPSTMLYFTAALTLPTANTANKLVVNYRINASSLSLEQGTDGLRRAAVGCYVQAFSEDLKPVKATRQLSEATLKPATYQRVMSEGFPCTTAIDLPSGKYQLRFAIRDERTGLIGSANGKVTIP
jgi:VWFA-related protein